MTIKTETILSEVGNWDGCWFYSQDRKRFPCLGWIQRDIEGRPSETIARFQLAWGDVENLKREEWKAESVTPFVRACAARQRGYIGPVF